MLITTDELNAIINGEVLEIYRVNKIIHNDISNKSKKHICTPPDKWPSININWDLSKDSQCFTLDGCKNIQFNIDYPNGLILGYVNVKEFDNLLCSHNKRNYQHLWSLGDKQKLAYLIQYASECRPITPPLVIPLATNQLAISGGNHRYTLAKFINENKIPIYVELQHKDRIANIISICWASQ